MSLNRKLGYIWVAPPATEPSVEAPFWQSEANPPAKTLADDLAAAEWRMDHLRDQIQNLGSEPRGRTRRALAEQMAERFIDAQRLTEAVNQLSDEERRYFVTLMLQANLQSIQAMPEGQRLWQGFSTPWPKLTGRLSKLGLALTTEEGGLLLPSVARQRLPDLDLPFPATAAPAHVVPPSDPRDLLTQIQQLLSLLQVETFRLRDRVRWKPPDYPYAKSVVSWPVSPADAQRLIRNINTSTAIELLPPEPYPEEAALNRWAKTLAVTTHEAEWLYALLLAGGLILGGSPLVVDSDRGHAWMALTPGRQLSLLYRMHRDIALAAVWWPAWRAGDLRVSRLYQGYWGLVSIDASVYRTVVHLRWTLLELLSALPEDMWLATKDLVHWLKELFPHPQNHRYLMGMEIEHARGGWSKFLEEVLLLTVKGPLRTFGLVEIGPSLEIVEAIRLRGLRDLHWDRVAEVALDVAGQLHREALRFRASDSTLEMTPPVPPDFMTLLLRWAKPAGFSRNLVLYQLDVERLHQAFESGEDPASLGEAWRASIGFDPLPEITAWWDTWWARYGHVRLYPSQAMLQTRDAITMEELQVALPDLQASILGVLTPDAALLRDEDVDRVMEDLARQGYMPKEVS